ncbi:hypothetical protein AVEN_53283-1 [Araneus ventricosus]|uniref:CCHC-type domain-containing protein n=1 Tax=Araneus ventricosus TaxID=182803 RepID=A0A4Y2A9W1_ARAVE|nr:hypothetical protein AVEN_53283-1 [Araneus ventricosus]
MEQVQEEMKDLIQAGKEEMRAHVESQVEEIKDHVDGCIGRMEKEVQDVRESLAVQFFVDAIRDEEKQLSTRLMDFMYLKSALAYSMKFESAKTASKISIYTRSIETKDDTWKERDDKFESLLKALEKLVNSLAAEQNAPLRNPNVTCWKCFKKEHVQRACQANDAYSGKLTCGRLAERKILTLNKSPEEGLKVSALRGGGNGLYLEGLVYDIPCLFLVDTGTNITLLRADLVRKLKERLIYTAPNLTLKTATGKKAKIQGKLDASIECGSRKFQHRVYVADITDSCILGLDFLQKFKFTVDLEKNEIWTGSVKMSLFSVSTQHHKRTSDGRMSPLSMTLY